MTESEEFELEKLRIMAATAREQSRNDLFKWFVALVWPVIVQLSASYIERQAIDKVAAKAAVVERKIDANSDSLDINTAINTKWQADRSGDPEDKAKADTAAAKVMLQAVKEIP